MPWLLLAGAAIGLALAATGLLEPRVRGGEGDAGGDVAAIVGERVIRRVDYERMLAGVEKDLRSPIDDATRRRVLERMVDEELLVQQALALGLAAADRRVRGELVSGLVDSVVAEADRAEPSAVEVERHYRENVDFFTRPGRLRVEALFFGAARGDAVEQARAARAQLVAGADPRTVERAVGDRPVAPVPDALLPLPKLRDYLGPAVVEALAELPTGEWSEPIASAEGARLIRILEREGDVAPPLVEVEALVRRDLVRRRGDEALRRYLDGLRETTPVELDESLFPAPDPKSQATERPTSVTER
ncbi:MAG: peptidyl-prolyl cis-trans isomerase [Deltaproteobacteria bacterium]|nr:peptidyl-prolyl cis-trans isomerase [Deltaproteobacteria bacterium]